MEQLSFVVSWKNSSAPKNIVSISTAQSLEGHQGFVSHLVQIPCWLKLQVWNVIQALPWLNPILQIQFELRWSCSYTNASINQIMGQAKVFQTPKNFQILFIFDCCKQSLTQLLLPPTHATSTLLHEIWATGILLYKFAHILKPVHTSLVFFKLGTFIINQFKWISRIS